MKFLKHLILVIVGSVNKTEEPDTRTDEELVEQIVSTNNTMLFTALYDRYSKKVYNKCFSFVHNEEEAKDLTQEVFLKLFIKLSGFEGKSKFSTWLFAFTYNFCANYVNRDKARKKEAITDSVDEHDYYLSSIEEDIPEDDLFEMQVSKLKIALENIDSEDKAILLLKYQDDVTVKELQKLYGISASAVKMRLKRARVRVLDEHNKLI